MMSALKCTTATLAMSADYQIGFPVPKLLSCTKGNWSPKNKTHMLQQLPLHHAFVSNSLLSPSDMIHSLLSYGMMSHSTTSIGTVFNPPLIDYQKVNSSNSPSMPTTGLQCCTNEQLKTTVLTDAVLHVDA
jgi:hypothetical protein